MAERLKAAVLKTVEGGDSFPGFESLSLRDFWVGVLDESGH